jgi:hypothetical protein
MGNVVRNVLAAKTMRGTGTAMVTTTHKGLTRARAKIQDT